MAKKGEKEEPMVSVEFLEDKCQFNCPLYRVKDRTVLKVGDIKNVLWNDGLSYLAKIHKIRPDGLVDVVYIEDKIKNLVSYDKIDHVTELQVGDCRDVKWRDNRYYPARILKIDVSRIESPEQHEKHNRSGDEQNLKMEKRPKDTSNKTLSSDFPGIESPEQHEKHNRSEDERNLKMEKRPKDTSNDTLPSANELPDRTIERNLEIEQNTSDISSEEYIDDTDADPDFSTRTDSEDSTSSSGHDDELNHRTKENNTSTASNTLLEVCLSPRKPQNNIILPLTTSEPKSCSDLSKESMTIEEENTALKEKIKLLEKQISRENVHNNKVSEDAPISFTRPVDDNDPVHDEEDNETNQIEPQKKTSKKYFCPFCSNLVDHFPRHLRNKHKTEEEIKKLKGLPPKSKERQQLIAKIRGRGALIFNTSDGATNHQLITARRFKEEVNDKKFKPCIHCNNFFKSTTLWKHYRKCTGNPAPRDLQDRSEAIILQAGPQKDIILNSSLKEILPGMDKDEVYSQILKDDAILELGHFMSLKHNEKHLKNMIRTKLRQVSKTLIEMKKINPEIKNLDESLDPKYYDCFVDAVKVVAGIKDCQYRSPSFVGEIGRTMKLIANRRIIHAIKKDDEQMKSNIENWLHIYNNDYYNVMGRNALRALQKKKWGKTQLVPLTEDVIKLNTYLNKKITQSEDILKKKYDNCL